MRASTFVKSSEAERAARSEGIESCDGIKLCDNKLVGIVDIEPLGFPVEVTLREIVQVRGPRDVAEFDI